MKTWKDSKIVNIICFFKYLNDKYQISLLASSISFYMLISIISILVLSLQIINLLSSNLQDLMIVNLLKIFNEAIINDLPRISFSEGSIIVVLHAIWSSSKAINGFNNISDKVYNEIEKRNFFVKRIKSIFVFLFLIGTIVVEMSVVIYGNSMISKYFANFWFIAKVLQMILELLIIYITIQIIYLYVPPLKMSIRATFKGAFLASAAIYIMLSIFTIFIYGYGIYNPAFTVIFTLTLGLLLLFVMNYIIILGMIVNYRLNIPSIKVTDESIINM